MNQRYQKNANGQDCELQYRLEKDQTGNQVKVELLVPVDTTLLLCNDKLMTIREYNQKMDPPNAIINVLTTGEKMPKDEWLERQRIKRLTKDSPSNQIGT